MRPHRPPNAPTTAWRVIGASVTGPSHGRHGTLCQDAHRYRLLPNGVLIAAVADGASTADRSQEGADIAVGHSLIVLEEALRSDGPNDEAEWRNLLTTAFTSAQQALTEKAVTAGGSIDNYATTLTCVVTNATWTAIAQIGDGATVVERTDDEMETIVCPQRGEYANTTQFLSMSDMLSHLDMSIATDPVNAIVIMTDGLWRLGLKMPQHKPHVPFFRPLIEFVRELDDEELGRHQLEDFLSSDRVAARSDDDKTIVLAARAPMRQTDDECQRPEVR